MAAFEVACCLPLVGSRALFKDGTRHPKTGGETIAQVKGMRNIDIGFIFKVAGLGSDKTAGLFLAA